MKTDKLKYDVKDLTNRLASSNKSDRMSALAEIAVSQSSELLDLSIGIMLNDPVSEVRERAAWTLDNLKDERALPAFLKAIHDDEFGVRSATGWGLVHLGDQVIPYMKEIMKTSSHSGAREMAELVPKNL